MARPLALDTSAADTEDYAPEKPAAGSVELPEVLPRLREDLLLMPGPPAADGSPTWTIFDPVRNRYTRIGWHAFEALSRWASGSPEDLMQAVEEETSGTLGPIELAGLIRFLERSGLTIADQPADLRRLEAQLEGAKSSMASFLLHRYLFVRIPLVRPDRFLRATASLIQPVFERWFIGLIALMGLIGLLLVLRQWDAFLSTFWRFFSIEGAIFFAVTLAGLKVVHEMGHAYTAQRYGCRIPSMGVALLVFWPVLYTDTTDAWRLTSRRQRLHIGMAGMAVELLLACVATLLWSFLPEGFMKTAAFFVASIAWVMTLVMNLNPCMKFDGYYLLSDWLGVENLQDRAFALAKWRMRETFFGFGEAPPEHIRPSMQRWMLIYAYATWLWRVILFVGIAFLVYHAFFKVLGMFLMAVEIGWFLFRPAWRELKEWWRRRDKMQWNINTITFAGVVIGGLVLLAVPWKGFVSVPAVLTARADTTVFAPVPARLSDVRVSNGDAVAAGDVLFLLDAPQIDYEVGQVEQRIRMVAYEQQLRSASGQNLQTLVVLDEELAAGLSELEGLKDVQGDLQVRAEISGVVHALPSFIKPGLWVSVDLPLATLVDAGSARATGYVASDDLGSIAVGASARFYPDDPRMAPIDMSVEAIETVNADVLSEPYLASVYGGVIGVDTQAPGDPLVPHDPVYRVFFATLGDTMAPAWETPGKVRVEGQSRSLLDRLWRKVVSVLIRESGF